VSFFPVFVSLLFAGCSDTERYSLIDEKCGRCHLADIVYKEKRTSGEWDRLVHGMKMRGLSVSADEEKLIMEYLYNKLGK
jgi:hypothetical protein